MNFMHCPTAGCASSRRLRVAHVSNYLDVGGLEKLLVEFARHADRERFDLHFVCLTTRGCLADDIAAQGWPVTALEEPEGLRPGMVLRLAQLFRRNSIDVVHTHDNKPLIYGALAARLAGASRILHTQHGRSFGIRPRQAFLVNRAADLLHHFVCVSEDSAALSIQQGVAAWKVRTICNGIDTALFNYAGPDREGPIVAVSRLCPEKDLETLLRATHIAVRQRPDIHVEIAGDGTCRSALQALARELGLEANVRFLGQVRDVPALLKRARLFVLSSISEGISLTLLEAMARGLPVVATAVGGTPEVVVDGVTGRLVPARDPEAFAHAMLEVRADTEAGRRMGLAGRHRVERHFDVRRAIAEYESLYLDRPFERSQGVRNQESGVRSQASGVRNQESGVRGLYENISCHSAV